MSKRGFVVRYTNDNPPRNSKYHRNPYKLPRPKCILHWYRLRIEKVLLRLKSAYLGNVPNIYQAEAGNSRNREIAKSSDNQSASQAVSVYTMNSKFVWWKSYIFLKKESYIFLKNVGISLSYYQRSFLRHDKVSV